MDTDLECTSMCENIAVRIQESRNHRKLVGEFFTVKPPAAAIHTMKYLYDGAEKPIVFEVNTVTQGQIYTSIYFHICVRVGLFPATNFFWSSCRCCCVRMRHGMAECWRLLYGNNLRRHRHIAWSMVGGRLWPPASVRQYTIFDNVYRALYSTFYCVRRFVRAIPDEYQLGSQRLKFMPPNFLLSTSINNNNSCWLRVCLYECDVRHRFDIY